MRGFRRLLTRRARACLSVARLRLNLPLSAQRVPSGAALTAFATSALCGPAALAVGGAIDDASRPAADPSVATVHRTWLSVQQRVRDASRLSTRKEFYAVLKDHLLYFYESESAATPSEAVALELFVALSITLSANRKAIVLRRGNRQDTSGGDGANVGGGGGGPTDIDFYLLQPKSDELQREWSALLRERALSGHKVFGVPLDELLERQKRKPPVPKLVESLIGYLDVNAIPAAVPRLLLAAPRSAALVQVHTIYIYILFLFFFLFCLLFFLCLLLLLLFFFVMPTIRFTNKHSMNIGPS